MKMQLYTIFDLVAEESGPIFEAKNDAVSLRKYNLNIQKDGINTAEFKLYRVGEIDHDTNEIIPSPPEEVSPKLSLVEIEEEKKSL